MKEIENIINILNQNIEFEKRTLSDIESKIKKNRKTSENLKFYYESRDVHSDRLRWSLTAKRLLNTTIFYLDKLENQ